MDKKQLSETDIRTKYITPAICGLSEKKWDLMSQIREEAYFTKGRVIVRGKTVHRGEAKKADYLLFYKPNLPIAVVEAKDNSHSVGATGTGKTYTAFQIIWRLWKAEVGDVEEKDLAKIMSGIVRELLELREMIR
jgi:type I site-specific restriction endonuclease